MTWNVKDAITYENFKGKKILVTGGRGFVGRHVVQQLLLHGAEEKNIFTPSSSEFDLRNQVKAKKAVKGRDIVVHLAARVGGIGFNQSRPADLIFDNAMMGLNIISACKEEKVEKVLVAGTVCAYPKFTPTPFREEDLWNGYPEETNAPYGVAKKMLLVALQAYRAQYSLHGIYLLPANLYGPHDNFDLHNSHVIPALIRKFVEAKKLGRAEVELWGDGSPSREFLYVDDVARGIVLALKAYDGPEPMNLGTHEETQIKHLAETIKKITDYEGRIVWNTSKPNGQPRRSLDVSRASEGFGFTAEVPLEIGLKKTIDWYLSSI